MKKNILEKIIFDIRYLSDKWTYISWLFTLGFLSLFSFGFYQIFKEKTKLSECSVETKAVIYKITRGSRGAHKYYVFYVNNVRYDNRFVTSHSLQIGDIVEIKYSCEDPSISRNIKVY
ncbi:hypothetical protein [Aureivirga sp. CE67]|uniref:hypothetical protein n=1 Tax=Aureivirga sp. CE67 TaxID=1788983 RepID=UPI0018CA7236|nr:hypothetical protein [Aureivirga sp. CE67]